MPKITIPTARSSGLVQRGEPGTLYAQPSTPAAFGAEIGTAATQLSSAMFQVDKQIREEQDRLDLSNMSLQFNLQMDAIKESVLTNPEIPFDKKGDALAEQTDKMVGDVRKLGRSPFSQNAFDSWSRGQYGHARLEVEHEGRKIETQNQLVAATRIDEDKLSRAARMPVRGFEANSQAVFNVMQEVKDRLAGNVASGKLLPFQAEAEEKRLFNSYWETVASHDPLTIMGLDMKGKPVPNMDMSKMNHYLDIAYTTQNRLITIQDRQLKETRDKVVKELDAKMWGVNGEPGQSIDGLIDSYRDILSAEQYAKAKEDNRKLEERRFQPTESQKRESKGWQTEFMELAHRAKYEPHLLDEQINFKVIHEAVFNDQKLLPEDANPVMAMIDAAMNHHKGVDSAQRRAITEAMTWLDVYKPMQSPKDTAFKLDNTERSMKLEMGAWLDANPDAKPHEIRKQALDIRKDSEGRILQIQKIRNQKADETLLEKEMHWKKLWGDNFVNDQHKIDPKQRKLIEKKLPLYEGIFKMFDEQVKVWEQGVKQGQDEASQAEGKRAK